MAGKAQHLRSVVADPEARRAENLTPVLYPSPTEPPTILFSWETLDQYKLSSPLAQGGMAKVFLAAHEVESFVHRPVVIKRLYAHLAADSNLVQMFLDEAKLLCRLEHPHVVRTYEAGIIDGQCCIAMEYLEGQTLDALLKRAHERSSMTPELAIEIVVSVLSGLHYAHEACDEDGRSLQIVHRDVSPHNVFVTNDGQVKLLDFGVAKTRAQESRTRTGIVKGKPGYIAPEQAKAEHVDRRADVWSAGVVLWEALTGVRLFKADTEAAAVLLMLTAEMKPPSAIHPDVPATIDAIVARALERNVDKRYQTAFDMRIDLEAISPWSSRDAHGLAKLMQTIFAEEIVEQRRLVSDLMARSDRTPPSGRASAPPESGSRGSVPPPLKARPSTPPPARVTRPSLPPAKVENLRKRVGAALVFALAFAGSFGLGAWALLSATRIDRGATQPPTRQLPAKSPVVPDQTPPMVVREEPPPLARPAEAVTALAAASGAVLPAQPEVSVTAMATAPKRAPSATAAPVPALPRIATDPTATVTVTPTATATPPPAPTATPPPTTQDAPSSPDPALPVAFGFLTIDTTPWSNVSLGGRALGQTPLVGVKLPAGVHTLTLKNPELGLETTYVVTIEGGKTQTRRIGLE